MVRPPHPWCRDSQGQEKFLEKSFLKIFRNQMQMLYQMQQKYNNPIFSGNINDTKVTNEQTILKKLKSPISTKLQQRHSKIPSTSNSKTNQVFTLEDKQT